MRTVSYTHLEPPQMELNEYICEAVHRKDLAYFSFFLHHFEKRLNGVIYRFLTRNGYDRYDPARFLDYKLEVLQMLLYCLPKFDPEQETEFLKYAKHYIRDGLLFCRMIGEAGSFASLAEYRLSLIHISQRLKSPLSVRTPFASIARTDGPSWTVGICSMP